MLELKKKIKKVKATKFYSDLIYVLIAQIVTMVVAFAINKIAGYYGGVDGYAVFNLVKRAGGLVACFMTAGLTVALPRYLALFFSSKKDINGQETLLLSSLLISTAHIIIIVLIFILFPKYIGDLFFHSNFEYILLTTTLIFGIGQTISNIAFAYYQGLGKFKAYNISHILCDIILLIFAIIFRDKILYIIIFSYIYLIIFGLIIIFAKTKKRISNQITSKILTSGKMLYSYGFPRMLEEFILFAENVIPLLIVLYKFGIETTGLYSAGLSLNLIITPIFTFSYTLLLQRFSNMLNTGNLQSIKILLHSSLIIFILISVLGSILIISMKKDLVNILLSASFSEALPLINYFALAIIPKAIYLLYKGPLDALSKKPYNLISVSIKTIILAIALFLSQSIIDCAIAYLYTNIFAAMLSLFFGEKVVRDSIAQKLNNKNLC